MQDDTLDDTTNTDENTNSADQQPQSFEPEELHEKQELAPASKDDDADEFEKNYQPSDLVEAFHIPVKISAVLGKRKIPVSELINLKENDIVKLDRNVGEAIDILVNDRLIARGEVVIMEDKLGVTMTEIIKKSDF